MPRADDPWLHSLKFIPVVRTDEETIALFCEKSVVKMSGENKKNYPRAACSLCGHWVDIPCKCAWVHDWGFNTRRIPDRIPAIGEDRGCGEGPESGLPGEKKI